MEDPLLPAAQPRMTPALGISSSTKGLSPSGFHFLLVYLYPQFSDRFNKKYDLVAYMTSSQCNNGSDNLLQLFTS